jgi:hypothetical protein
MYMTYSTGVPREHDPNLSLLQLDFFLKSGYVQQSPHSPPIRARQVQDIICAHAGS